MERSQCSMLIVVLLLTWPLTYAFQIDSGSSRVRHSTRLHSSTLTPINARPIKKKNLKSFTRYLEVECWKQSELRDLQPVLQAVGDACKQINRLVQRAQTDDLYGEAATSGAGETNIQGEVQQKLDTLCNTIFLKTFCGCSNAIASVASEEEDETRSCADVMGDSAFAVGDFVAVFDPLDGSKNIDASLPVGSIFGIYKKASR